MNDQISDRTDVVYNSTPPTACVGPGSIPADLLMRRQRLVDEVRQVWLMEHEWHGLREPACPICSAGHMVHDHGPESGAGLACRERRTEAGLLRGECLVPGRVVTSPGPTPLNGSESYPGDPCPEHGPLCVGSDCCCRDKHRTSPAPLPPP